MSCEQENLPLVRFAQGNYLQVDGALDFVSG
jgi:hypothetical protein